MVLPGNFETGIALFSIAKVRPPMTWINEACKRALEYEVNIDTPLIYVNESEVDTAGWSLQKVAEWVVENIARDEDSRACSAFVVADDKSVETDSLLVVAIDSTTFGLPNQNYHDHDEKVYQQEFHARVERHHKDIAARYPPEPNANPKVIIERVYRASPELCASDASLIQFQWRNIWDDVIDDDNPDDLDAISPYIPKGSYDDYDEDHKHSPFSSPGHTKEGLRYRFHQSFYSFGLYVLDYLTGHGMMFPYLPHDYARMFVGKSDNEEDEKGNAMEATQCCSDNSPLYQYRLANGNILGTCILWEDHVFERKPLPQVFSAGHGMVDVLGRFEP